VCVILRPASPHAHLLLFLLCLCWLGSSYMPMWATSALPYSPAPYMPHATSAATFLATQVRTQKAGEGDGQRGEWDGLMWWYKG
jgi:hypothetical protein